VGRGGVFATWPTQPASAKTQRPSRKLAILRNRTALMQRTAVEVKTIPQNILHSIRQGSRSGQQVDGPSRARPSLLKWITLAFFWGVLVCDPRPQDRPHTDAHKRHPVKYRARRGMALDAAVEGNARSAHWRDQSSPRRMGQPRILARTSVAPTRSYDRSGDRRE
jgi:hypothetical protein